MIYDRKRNNRLIFISMMKVIAACLITNTHYNNVYPTESLAVGGLMGDVLFFVVSGYCYGTVGNKQKFIPWYIKRILRIYPSVLIMLFVHHLVGYWDVSKVGWFKYYIFPTNFTFVGSIMVVYIITYCYSKINNTRVSVLVLLCAIAIWVLLYFAFFDKSKYFMNDTSHLSCFILYSLCSMTGVLLKKCWKADLNRNNKQLFVIGICLIIVVIGYYFANKYIRTIPELFDYQIIIPVLLLIFSFYMMKFFMHLEGVLRTFPEYLLIGIDFLSTLTLEIYVVQRVIIRAFENIVFPINWILITASILAAAVLLHYFCERVTVYANCRSRAILS